MISVAHVITTLDVGGAERALTHVATGLRARGLRQLVVSMQPPGPMADRLRDGGVKVHSLDMDPAEILGSGPAGAAALVRLLRRAAPDVVQTWMYHADVIGGTCARLAGVGAVAWNVRHADLPLEGYGRTTAALGRLSQPLSQLVPRVIVTNSAAALETHVARGYPRSKMRLVPNGVPLPGPDAPTRTEARAALSLPDDAFVVGRVGRIHGQKDLPTFLRAARHVRDHVPNVRFAVIGSGADAGNAELTGWIANEGLQDVVHLCGPRSDAAVIQVAFDLAVSSSAYGETCPNAVLEAMIVGVPVATTDVGDSARMVGETGRVVPPRDPGALANAVLALAGLPGDERRVLGTAARARVEERFSLPAMLDGYEAVYRELADGRARR